MYTNGDNMRIEIEFISQREPKWSLYIATLSLLHWIPLDQVEFTPYSKIF